MESITEQEELLEEFLWMETLVKENPCGMPKSMMTSLKSVLRDFVGKHCVGTASREELARYLGKDVRTISRWKKEYSDFPEGKLYGKKELSYSWEDVIKWKLRHKELF